jgi:hypothetical protein
VYINIIPAIDADGNHPRLLGAHLPRHCCSRPEPFQCKIEPRNAERKDIARQEWEEKEALIADGMARGLSLAFLRYRIKENNTSIVIGIPKERQRVFNIRR